MDEHEPSTERIFHAALALPPAERAGYVAAECDDPAQAREVLELLEHHDDSGRDLAALPFGAGLEEVADELGVGPRPEAIGPYRIERTLGRGGFGVVYLAEQRGAVRRKVALKVVKRGMDTEDVVRRFEAERQALALLDHPGIAKVYDAGITADGRPFFAMEYVPGAILSEHCDARRLATEDRLRLFIGVCEAVQHAHQKGILHRDLKPSNLLVRLRGDAASPVVIDFGLAKALHQPLIESAHVTRAGAFVGTPEFASPEQLRSDGVDVDTRSDVYSLGAVLYHLLTGELPRDPRSAPPSAFAGGRAAPEGAPEGAPPPAPSRRVSTSALSRETAQRRRTEPQALARRLRGDLDLITLKALAWDRTERYASVSELAADLARHLAHEPILAAPPDLRYRARKFVRRHRGAVTAAAALLATLVLGLFGTATGWRQASRELARAEAAQASALAELRASNAIQRHLTDVLGAANPWARAGLPGLAREAKIVDALALAATRASAAFEGLPAIEGAVRRTIGQNYQALGLSNEAEAQLRAALELVRGARGDDDRWTTDVKAALATTLQSQGNFDECRRLREAALAWLRAHEPEGHEALLEVQRDLANLATISGRLTDAEPALRDVLRRAESLLGPTHRTTRACRFDLAALEYSRGAAPDAARLLQETYDACVAEVGRDDPETIDVAVALGGVLAVTGRDDEAAEMLRRAVEDATRVLGERHPVTLGAINNLGQAYQRSGDDARAEPLLRKAVEIGTAVRGARHANTLEARANLGLLQRRHGDFEGAEENLRECWTATCEAQGPRSLDAAAYELYLAYVEHDLERYDVAESHFRSVVDIRREALGDTHPETTVARNRLGTFLLGRARLDEAAEVLTKALADGRARLPLGDSTVIATFEALIAVREDQGRVEDQAALQRELEAWTAAAR